MLKIITWNVNSINARTDHLLSLIETESPDIILLQELKCAKEAFPYHIFEDKRYNIAINAQKTYNGVAIFSKHPLSDIVIDFPNNPLPNEARYIEAIVNFSSYAIRVASVYVPNGGDLTSEKFTNKLEFLGSLGTYYKKLTEYQEILIIGGDFNVALDPIDAYDPDNQTSSLLYSTKERQYLKKFVACGLVDLLRIHHHDEAYSWWDYRANSFRQNHGMRIDYLFGSPEAAETCHSVSSLKAWRSKDKPSDHAPVLGHFSR